MGNNPTDNLEFYTDVSMQQKNDYYYDRNITIYDSLPYVRDQDLCNMGYLYQHNSNIIRNYKYDPNNYCMLNCEELNAHKKNK